MSESSGSMELLLDNDIQPLIKPGTFDQNSLDPTGYDLRMGPEILLVTRGERKSLSDGQSIEIFPGETVLVKTEEVLCLPQDVFAMGAPKMSLITEGLWSHGGKTDFGFNQSLTLAFHNVGAKPYSMRRSSKIFHLTFIKVLGKPTTRYSGQGVGFPSFDKSPLDGTPKLDEKLENLVKTSDGIQSYRVIRILRRTVTTFKYRNYITNLALLSIVIIVILGYSSVIGYATALSGSLAAAILSLLLQEIVNWRRQKK